MNFKFYDLLAFLVPGIIILWVLLDFAGIAFKSDLALPYTGAAFVLGYFLNTLASWLEDFYYWTWGGKPSNQMLAGHDIWKVRFYHSAQARQLLVAECPELTNPRNEVLFALAYRYAKGTQNPLVDDFNVSYAFSRVVLTLMLCSAGLLLVRYHQVPATYLVLPLIVTAWLRSKQRGYYFAREVLTTYLHTKLNATAPKAEPLA